MQLGQSMPLQTPPVPRQERSGRSGASSDRTEAPEASPPQPRLARQLFDSRLIVVLVLHFDDQDVFADLEVITEPAVVLRYCRIRRRARIAALLRARGATARHPTGSR
ncbi:DUF6879 family protein [Streptomyces sp. NPDC001450]